MKKDLLYTAALYVVLVAYLLGGLLVQLVGGVEKWTDAPEYLALVFGAPLVVAVPAFLLFRPHPPHSPPAPHLSIGCDH